MKEEKQRAQYFLLSHRAQRGCIFIFQPKLFYFTSYRKVPDQVFPGPLRKAWSQTREFPKIYFFQFTRAMPMKFNKYGYFSTTIIFLSSRCLKGYLQNRFSPRASPHSWGPISGIQLKYIFQFNDHNACRNFLFSATKALNIFQFTLAMPI